MIRYLLFNGTGRIHMRKSQEVRLASLTPRNTCVVNIFRQFSPGRCCVDRGRLSQRSPPIPYPWLLLMIVLFITSEATSATSLSPASVLYILDTLQTFFVISTLKGRRLC
ncbi:hypothetical protein KQX54_018990 [Cotesia glomerata]|uniref:Uncharacterized protein n=1 Tax=Cotesia glomerata TaxID=32391 RepID=A0AAV7HYH9_COTGL|nr:hypothetical protein KQX54_018990 [Cotesia glomerata]